MGNGAHRVALAILVLAGCKADPRPRDVDGAPDLVSYAVVQPAELARIAKAFDEGRGEALQRCSEAMELVDAIKDPVDTAAWGGLVTAAERSGRSRFFADRHHENASFLRVLREGDDEIVKRTASAAQFTAQQRGCSSAGDVAGATMSTFRTTTERRLETRGRATSEAAWQLQGQRDALGKPNLPPLGKQLDALAQGTFLIEVALPELAYRRDRLAAELPIVKQTLARALDVERERQARSAAADTDRKLAEDRVRELTTAAELADAMAPRAASWSKDAPRELRETREGCAEILEALHRAIAKRGHQ
ncbi:MAG: hypothetical protein FJ096_01935 [Deltaproteobacteria bacterium]|nr:hypothetical protein [Deltaproteobacteria bacterium]